MGDAPMSSRIIVCGSTSWTAHNPIRLALKNFSTVEDPNVHPITIVHGDAVGADRIAASIAKYEFDLTVEPHPADWRGQGRTAGFQRNRRMLDAGADLVVAFKDNFDHTYKTGGTENMVKIAADAGIPGMIFKSTYGGGVESGLVVNYRGQDFQI